MSQAGQAEIEDVPTRTAHRSSRILVNAGFRATADIGSKVATALLYIFVARKLGASQLGIYAFGLSFVGLVTAFGYFGQDIVLAREVSRDRRHLERYYSNAMLARILFSVVPLLLALGIAALAGLDHHTWLVVLLLGFGLTGEYMVQVPFAVFQAYERLEFVTVVLIAQRWVTTGTAIAALYLGVGLVGVVAIYAAGSLLGTALGTWMMYRYIARPRLHFDLRGALSVTRQAFPIGLALVGLILLARIDMSMLAIFKPSSEVGQYGAAYKLLEATAFISWAVNIAVLPSLARLTPSSTPTVGFVYQRALKLLIAVTLPLAVAAIVLAGPIVSLLYGAQYHRAATALQLLAATIALAPISAMTAQLFYVHERRPTVAIVYAAVALENILLNLILIPRFSLYGAAAGTSISELLVVSTLILLAGALHGKFEVRRMIVGPVLASAVCAAALLALRSHLAVALCVGAVVYLGVLLCHERFAFPDDFSVLHDLLAQFRSRLTGRALASRAS